MGKDGMMERKKQPYEENQNILVQVWMEITTHLDINYHPLDQRDQTRAGKNPGLIACVK